MRQSGKAVVNKKPDVEKLIEYGFGKEDGCYCYSADISDGEFCLNVIVREDGTIEFSVIDRESGEEYTLVKNEEAVGSFVGAIRLECERILDNIVEKCYVADVFKSEYARLVIKYIKNKYGAEAEYLWEKLPNAAAFREPSTKKWYATLLRIEKRKLGLAEGGTVEIIDLKEVQENIAAILDGKRYFCGYHMNKKHWYMICLDGSVAIEEIYWRIDCSFNLVKKK